VYTERDRVTPNRLSGVITETYTLRTAHISLWTITLFTSQTGFEMAQLMRIN